MNRHALDAFIKFADKFIKDKTPRRKLEMELSNPQYTNWHNLRHFHIIFQEKGTAKWILTKKGEQFFRGEIKLMVPAAHMGGATLDSTHPAWETHTAERKELFIWELLKVAETAWKQREEFQKEKGYRRQTLF